MAYYANPYMNQYSYMPNPPAQQPAQQTGVNWVQGEAAARSWMVAPNTTVLLMDSESERFYLKSTDASGMPLPLRIFEYKERTGEQKPNPIDKGSYVTREEFDAFKHELLYGNPEKAGKANESAL